MSLRTWPGAAGVDWLVPWHPILDGSPSAALVDELYREVGKGHVLHGITVRAVGRRQDCDDALFELLDGSGRFAVVHLTFARHPEPDSRWPESQIYANWPAFDRNRMRPDADDWAT